MPNKTEMYLSYLLKILPRDREKFMRVHEAAFVSTERMVSEIVSLYGAPRDADAELLGICSCATWEDLRRDIISDGNNPNSILIEYDADPRRYVPIVNDFSRRFWIEDEIAEWENTDFRDLDMGCTWITDDFIENVFQHHSGQSSKIEWALPKRPWKVLGYFKVAGSHHYFNEKDDFFHPGIRRIVLERDENNTHD